MVGDWQPPDRSGMSASQISPPYCIASMLPSGENEGELIRSAWSGPSK